MQKEFSKSRITAIKLSRDVCVIESDWDCDWQGFDNDGDLDFNMHMPLMQAVTEYRHLRTIIKSPNEVLTLKNRLLHSYHDKPAYMHSITGRKRWYRGGKLHRGRDLPAVVYDNFMGIVWAQNGLQHREDRPARIVLENWHFSYLHNGHMHRTDGPARFVFGCYSAMQRFHGNVISAAALKDAQKTVSMEFWVAGEQLDPTEAIDWISRNAQGRLRIGPGKFFLDEEDAFAFACQIDGFGRTTPFRLSNRTPFKALA